MLQSASIMTMTSAVAARNPTRSASPLPIPSWYTTRMSGLEHCAAITVASVEFPSTRMISSTHSGICWSTHGMFAASFLVGMTRATVPRCCPRTFAESVLRSPTPSLRRSFVNRSYGGADVRSADAAAGSRTALASYCVDTGHPFDLELIHVCRAGSRLEGRAHTGSRSAKLPTAAASVNLLGGEFDLNECALRRRRVLAGRRHTWRSPLPTQP